MLKRVILVSLVLSMLTGCGRIPEEGSSKADPTISPSEIAEQKDDRLSGKSIAPADNIEIRSSNIYNDDCPFRNTLSGDAVKEIAEQFDVLIMNSSDLDTSPESSSLSFRIDGDNGRVYFYCGDGIWAYKEDKTNRNVFLPDDNESSEMLADKLCFYTVMPTLLSANDIENVDFEADFSQPSYSSMLSEVISGHNCETLFFYVDDRTSRSYYYIIEDEGIYYSQESDSLTDAEINGTPYYQTFDEYEYFGNADEAYFRNEMYDVFYIADSFEGEYQPEFLAKRLTDNYDFSYSFKASADDDDFTCEIFRNDEETAYVLLDEDNEIYAAWFLGSEGIRLMYGIRCEDTELGLEELFEHARDHRDDVVAEREAEKNKTVPEWQSDDIARLGFFELDKIEEGQALSDPQTVQSYIEYLNSGEPYTFEYWSIGGARYDYYFVTDNGNNCYGYEDISSHDNSFDYSIEEIYVGDYVYYSDDNGGYTRYVRNEPKGHEAKYNLPEAFRNAKNLSFSRGYIGTVNGEEYEIEEWDWVNDTAVFFCQNGEVKAFKYEVNDSERCFYITRYEKNADEQYIAVPSSSREIID